MKCKVCGQDVPELTAGEKWARTWRGAELTCAECPLTDDGSNICSMAKTCNDCVPALAKAYDQGYTDGRIKGAKDEAVWSAQLESQKTQPEPAMTADEWEDRHTFTLSTMDAIHNYIRLNKGKVIQ